MTTTGKRDPPSSDGDRIEETLPADEEGGSVAHGRASARDEGLGRGAQVGRYTVLERIGAGGMGVVYAAFDPQLDRRVALKVMHPGTKRGSMGGSGGRSRLLREAQAMAKLNHQNVITVHDVGTFGERVFVAMEFIEGSTLRDWLQQSARDWPEVVDAFVRAGRGLASAHAAGLVHRDFKPDNVLIGIDRRVLVMDFGLARQAAAARTGPVDTDNSSSQAAIPQTKDLVLTRTGALLGTPAYMAPEQHAGGTMGPSVDQFSFCVALYEGLYGERPFSGTSVTSIAMNVLEGRIRPPPRDAKVPSWLRVPVLRGLSVDPDDRFPSMDALLAELQRDPPQPRRPWVGVGVAVGVSATIVLGYLASRPPIDTSCQEGDQLFAATWNHERGDAVSQAVLDQGLPYGVTTWTSVTTILDTYAERWAKVYVRVCEADQAARKEDPNRPTSASVRCMDQRRKEVEALIAAYNDATPTTVEHAVQAAQALTSVDSCVGVQDVDPATLSTDMTTRSKSQAVRDGMARARALARTGQPEDALSRLRPLDSTADYLDAPALQADVKLLLGEIFSDFGESTLAEHNLRNSILAAAAARRTDIEARAWVDLIHVVGTHNRLHGEGRRVALAAEAAIERAGNPPALTAALLTNLAMLDDAEADYASAQKRFEAALELRQEASDQHNLEIAVAHEGTGLALEGLGRFDKAGEHYDAAMKLREQVLGVHHPLVGVTAIHMGRARLALDDAVGAEGDLARARDALGGNKVQDPKDTRPELGAAIDLLGTLRRSQQDFEEAEGLHEQAVELLEAHHGKSHVDVAYVLENLGLSLADQGLHAVAIGHLRRALQILSRRLPLQHPDIGLAHVNLANSLLAVGEVELAGAHYGHALTVWDSPLAEDHPLIAYALTGLGRVQTHTGKHAAAVELLERALAIRDNEGEDQRNLAESLLVLARALWADRSEPRRALQLLIRARDILGATEPSDDASMRRVLAGGAAPTFTDQLQPAGLGASIRRLSTLHR